MSSKTEEMLKDRTIHVAECATNILCLNTARADKKKRVNAIALLRNCVYNKCRMRTGRFSTRPRNGIQLDRSHATNREEDMARKRKQLTVTWALGQRVRELRQGRGLTMKELVERAERLGFRLPWRTLSDLERGERQNPQLSTLLAIAGALGMELSRLVLVQDDYTDSPEEEFPMTNRKNPREALQQKIKRKNSLIRKWKTEGDACDPANEVGRAVKRYCLGLARWQEEERERLEAQMRQIGETGSDWKGAAPRN